MLNDDTTVAPVSSLPRSPLVTVVTPARDAAGLLDRCLASVARQTMPEWEQVIVIPPDDHATRRVAQAAAARDARVRIVLSAADTAAAARNAGLAVATGVFVLFLDADDSIAATHLARLSAAIGQEGDGDDIVISGYRLRAPCGQVIDRRPWRQSGVVEAAALLDGLPAALHAMLFRRQAIAAVGGFDAGLVTNEDWDLCLRLVGGGASMVSCAGISADYWMIPGSLSTNDVRMVADRAQVCERAHGLLAVPEGERTVLRGADALRCALWAGARTVASGGDAMPVLGALAALCPVPPLALTGDEMAEALLDSLLRGFACRHRAIEHRMAGRWPALEAFLAEVARITGDPGLDHTALAALETELARIGPVASRRIGRSLVVAARPLSQRWLRRAGSEGVRQVIVRVPLPRPRSRSLAVFAPQALPDTSLPALMARRIGRWVAGLSGGNGPGEWSADGGRLARLRDRLARGAILSRRVLMRRSPAGAEAPAAVDPTATTDWEAIFASEDPWNYHRLYEQRKYDRTIGLLPRRRFRQALELACAEGLFTEQLAGRVDALTAADISPTAIERARARCAGAGHCNVDFAVLDFFNQPFGEGWDLIVSSEVLYYMESREMLARYAERVAAALADGGLFLHAHAYEVSDDPGRSGFDWGDDFAATTISAVFRANHDLVLERAVESEVYRIELFRKRTPVERVSPKVPAEPIRVSVRDELDPVLAADVVWNGARVTRIEAEGERHTRLPVLLYHSIAEDGPAGLSPWRVTPQDFEHQLRFLRRRGYRSVTLDEWERARDSSGALSGRPVLITFDDGFADFAETAWPILKRNGFGAHLFVVSGHVGQCAQWDAFHGTPLSLMDWDCLADLARDGVGLGAHMHQHRALDRLAGDELLRDAMLCRDIIATRTGALPDAVAPPYGVCAPHHADLLSRAGFGRVFLADGGMAPVWGPRLATPRIEVPGGVSIARFAELVGAAEAPEAADLP